ncbi:MAG: sugar nucleotide-binding protein [Verrucomicrobiae bacterium]|nr:sugar nucleotide-binding protein [Verrucomicrobiae bacterium]
MKYLILGGNGYVASAYTRALAGTGIPFRCVSRREVDYADPGVLADYLRQQRPAFLINAAGYTGKPNVDACEKFKSDCLFGNAVLPGIIRQACEETGTTWGHVSSGCIYSGTRPDGSGFTEEDAPNFCFRTNHCSFYSGSKALGEEVLAGAERCYVWRLRIPFDRFDSPRNYLSKLMTYDRILDATNSITCLPDFIRTTLDCLERGVPFGVYNVTNPGFVTAREVIDMILREGLVQKEFKFFTDEKDFMQKAAITPRSNCILDSGKWIRAGLTMPAEKEAIRWALKNWTRA